MLSLSVYAGEITYDNVISDTTSIEEDFEILGFDIEDYYEPTQYNYEKWYVIGMAESYLDETDRIQTYFYLYNPTRYGDPDYMSTVASFNLAYKLNDNPEESISAIKLDYDQEHLIYKVKGFAYPYVEQATVFIIEIQHHSLSGNGIQSESDFSANLKHSDTSGFQVEINFNTVLIIEEYQVVEIEVYQDDNFLNNWESFWKMGETRMLVYFYNFNFPEHVSYDSVEYAKFSYIYNTYYEKIYLDSLDFSPSIEYAEFNIKELKSREKVVSEYNTDSKTLRVNQHSQELTFPTFYLGNRIEDQQFGTLDVSGELDSFNYDCSVLLDSTFKTIQRDQDWPKPLHRVSFNHIDYTTLDEVEMIELHYKHDGIVYKCQVIDQPVDEDDFQQGTARPPQSDSPWWEQILEAFRIVGAWILGLFDLAAPSFVQKIVGAVVCFIGVLLIPAIIRLLINLISSIINMIFK